MDYKLILAEHGNFAGIKVNTNLSRPNGKRANITGFSKGSRKRILTRINTINQKRLFGKQIFITLTYSSSYPLDAHSWKRDLDNFLKQLKRLNPKSVAIWRMEFQERGAPHFHIILMFTDPSDICKNVFTLRKKLKRAWFRISNIPKPDQTNFACDVNYIESWRGVTYYTGKYICKAEQSNIKALYPDYLGRFWGISNRKFLPIDILEIEISPAEFVNIRRFLRTFVQKKTNRKLHLWSEFAGLSGFIDYKSALKLYRAGLMAIGDLHFKSEKIDLEFYHDHDDPLLDLENSRILTVEKPKRHIQFTKSGNKYIRFQYFYNSPERFPDANSIRHSNQ